MLVTAGYFGNMNVNRKTTSAERAVHPVRPCRSPDPRCGLRTTQGCPGLPPDSQSHQFTCRELPLHADDVPRSSPPHAATQNEIRRRRVLPAPAGRSSADAEMTTTLAQAGIKARPMPRLTLLANVRYEKKEDDTPVALYNVEGGPTTAFTNSPASKKRLNTKLEGSYLLPADLRATLGIDLESVDHGEFTPTSAVAGLSGLKQKTKEQGYASSCGAACPSPSTASLSTSTASARAIACSSPHRAAPRTAPVRDRGHDDPSWRPPAAPASTLHLHAPGSSEPVQGTAADKVKALVSWCRATPSRCSSWPRSGKTSTGRRPRA